MDTSEQNLKLLRTKYPELRISVADDPDSPERLQYRFYSGWTQTMLLLTLPRDHVLKADEPQPERLVAFYKKHQQLKEDDYDDEHDRVTGNLISLWH